MHEPVFVLHPQCIPHPPTIISDVEMSDHGLWVRSEIKRSRSDLDNASEEKSCFPSFPHLLTH